MTRAIVYADSFPSLPGRRGDRLLSLMRQHDCGIWADDVKELRFGDYYVMVDNGKVHDARLRFAELRLRATERFIPAFRQHLQQFAMDERPRVIHGRIGFIFIFRKSYTKDAVVFRLAVA